MTGQLVVGFDRFQLMRYQAVCNVKYGQSCATSAWQSWRIETIVSN